jgi:hypothetical protein
MRRWTTPDGLAFEGLQTGDGRIFVPGAFYWDDQENGWPLRFDREDDGWHAGAVLVGSIDQLARADEGRITGEGQVDDDSEMGAEVVRMLDNDAPLGISVDMDDLEVEWVVSAESMEEEDGEVILLGASFPHATLMQRRRRLTAAATETGLVWELYAEGIGRLQRQVFEDLGASLTAAAGDGDFDDDDSIVLFAESMDEVLTRFTRARIRGATLVDIPAFDRAAIRLEPAEGAEGDGGSEDEDALAALLAGGVLTVIGAAGLPLADRDRAWDASAARSRMAGDGDDLDTATFRRGHFYLDPDADAETAGAYKLPFADKIDGTLTAIPKGLFAVAGALGGARGGVSIPDAEKDRIRSKVSAYYAAMRRKFDDDSIVPPWDSDSARAEVASGGAGDGECADCPGVEHVFARARAAASLTAASAAAPMRPPRAWFDTPKWAAGQVVELEDPKTGRRLRGVPMEYRDDGEVVGHLALWGQCHTGSNGECILTPRSATGYVPFHHGQVELDDGTLLAVGNLTLGGGHADGRLSYAGALAHYDDVSTLAAQGRCGEDDYGVWFHGAGMPDVWDDELAMRKLRAASPSGDWREVGAGLELCAALGVCSPGFPVPRAMVAAGGRVTSLVAAGAREVAMLRQVQEGPRGQRLAEIVQAAVTAGVDEFVRRQNRLASEPARRELERLRRERAIEVLRGA